MLSFFPTIFLVTTGIKEKKQNTLQAIYEVRHQFARKSVAVHYNTSDALSVLLFAIGRTNARISNLFEYLDGDRAKAEKKMRWVHYKVFVEEKKSYCAKHISVFHGEIIWLNPKPVNTDIFVLYLDFPSLLAVPLIPVVMVFIFAPNALYSTLKSEHMQSKK